MKALLLTASTLLACVSGAFAQNLPPDYNWEVGVNVGQSTLTRPLGPATSYQGTRTKTVHDYSVRLDYFFDPHWMLHLDIGDRHWESYGNWKINDLQGQQLKSRPITFVVADHAINENVAINYVIPFYSRYNRFNRANLYFGVCFGLMQTVNDGSIKYSNYKSAPDSALTYMSKYDYGSGTGFNTGFQIGYTWYVIPRLGINVELAMRYAQINTIDTHYGSENAKFHTIYFPETLGLRWRF